MTPVVNAPDGICDKRNCVPCDYSTVLSYIVCDYYLRTGKRRPNPAGNGCKVRTVKGVLKPLPYQVHSAQEKKIYHQKPKPEKTAESGITTIDRAEFLKFQAKRLLRWRFNQDLTQRQIANLIGVGKTTYNNWENGKFVANTAKLKDVGLNLMKEYNKQHEQK